MNESRIIKPSTTIRSLPGGQMERQALLDANKRLALDRAELLKINMQQKEFIKGMNAVFSGLAAQLGTPVPKSTSEAVGALEAMKKRIADLIEIEKTVQMP